MSLKEKICKKESLWLLLHLNKLHKKEDHKINRKHGKTLGINMMFNNFSGKVTKTMMPFGIELWHWKKQSMVKKWCMTRHCL